MADEQDPLTPDPLSETDDTAFGGAAEPGGAALDGDTAEPGGAAFGGEMLSQDELNSLLAAAQQEEAFSAAQADISAHAETLFSDTGTLPDDELPSVLNLPSFDAPSISSDAGSSGMGRVRDIPLEVTVELGRTRLLIKDILELGTGSIIELDKLAGEPVDLFANGLMVARGEVIVIDDNFGVRVTEIITAADRKREAVANERAA